MIKQFFLTIIPLMIFDATWFSVMKPFYTMHIGYLMASKVQFAPAIIFYVIYAIGIMVLVTTPSIRDHASFGRIFLMGALLGLCAYGAYDFTNHATTKNWPLVVTVVDLGWGTVMTGIVSVLSAWFLRLF
jgi:uncharacterized membrane protein